MTKYKTTLKPIPTFKSYEEEAEFWDTHDITDYVDLSHAVKMNYPPPSSQGITVRFKPDDLGDLKAIAQHKGVGVTTLIRMATLEYLHGHLSKPLILADSGRAKKYKVKKK